jgi:hypothetical protein
MSEYTAIFERFEIYFHSIIVTNRIKILAEKEYVFFKSYDPLKTVLIINIIAYIKYLQ